MSLLWHKWKIRPCSFCHQREKTDEHFHNPRSTATGKQTRWSQKSFSATLGSRWPASSSPPSFSLQTSSDLSSCYFALQSHWYMHNMQLSYLKLSSSKGGSVRLYAFLGAHHWCRQRRQRHHCHWPLCRLLRSVIVMTTLILRKQELLKYFQTFHWKSSITCLLCFLINVCHHHHHDLVPVHICHAFLTVSGSKKQRAHAAMVKDPWQSCETQSNTDWVALYSLVGCLVVRLHGDISI